MSQAVFEKLLNLLEGKKVKFQLYEHQPVYTSQQAAGIRKTKIEQGAKALVMMADKKPILVVISAAKKVDFKKIKRIFGFRDLRMAKPEEVRKATGIEVGAVPPWGEVLNLPTFVDKSLGENRKIVFNAGLHTKSIKMDYQDYYLLVQPKLGDFSLTDE